MEVDFVYGFEGWLLKINGVEFPAKYIRADTYIVTPDQETDLDDYTDNNGVFHRNILPAKATKIEFSTPYMWLQDMSKVLEIIPQEDDSVSIEYWNPRKLQYQSGTAYVPDVSWEPYMIDRSTNNILYKEVRFAFIEYGEVR